MLMRLSDDGGSLIDRGLMRSRGSVYVTGAVLAASWLLVGCDGEVSVDAKGSDSSAAVSASPSSEGGQPSSSKGNASSSGGGSSSSSKGSSTEIPNDDDGDGFGNGTEIPNDDDGDGFGNGDNDGDGFGNRPCRTRNLSFRLGDVAGDDQRQLPVIITNRGTSGCTLKGFPGVDLLSASDSWSLARSSKAPKAQTVAPGGTTGFTITYLPWEKGSGKEFNAATLVVTPPGETTSKTLTWPGGSVLRQDAATHPGTYTGPIGD
ncbi:DUF4232 domain-containing protein [Streptomyces sp. NPDC005500]|uniref:DUF4232 domain-containing protein n=1 Tax=Streptomyces sp. NPDC005500 TaxID=3155007 RepID=UPI0033A3DBF6